MKIETKFDINQTAFYIYRKQIYSFTIGNIDIEIADGNIEIEYFDYYGSGYGEDELFDTKEEAEAKLKDLLKGDK